MLLQEPHAEPERNREDKHFEFGADAFDWLDRNGFSQHGDTHRDFAHQDGRTARVFLPDDETGEQNAVVAIFTPLGA